MTAQDLLKIAKAEKPEILYTTNHKGNAIAAKHKPEEHWIMVAGRLDSGEWVTVGNLQVDGCEVVTDWVEV